MKAEAWWPTFRVVLIFVACLAIATIYTHFANVLQLWFVPLFIWLFVGMGIGVVCHELGHLAFATICSIPVRIIRIGTGPILLRQRFGETWLELRAVPYSGFVGPYPPAVFRRWRFALFYLGGVMGNVAVIGAVAGLDALGAVSNQAGNALGGIVLAQVCVMITALVPYWAAVGGDRLASDGLLILQLLRPRRAGSMDYSAFYATVLSRYTSGANPPPVMSLAGSRVLHHLHYSDRWDKESRRDSRESLLRELERGELSREEQMLVLDNLLTDALIHGDSEVRPFLDDWSLRALKLGPELVSLLCTRGAVLIELGHHQEGKALLTSMEKTGQLEPFDSLVNHVFLARAEYALGNIAAAQQFATAAQTMAAAGPASPATPLLLARLDPALAITPPPTHGTCPSWLSAYPRRPARERA